MTRAEAKHVVITGASSGIGAATAEAFAPRVACLVLAARSREALAVSMDVTDADAVASLSARARNHLGEIDL